MKKSMEKGFITPHPVFVIATYDESVLTDGAVDLDKLHPIMFDTVAKCYREIGANIGGAWAAGKKFE